MMAPAAFFGCLAAVERGYYEGLCNMYPTAISQAVESIAKVACGLLFSHYVFTHETQVLAYFPAGTPILPIAAAAAVLGVTLSTACGVCISFPQSGRRWAAKGCIFLRFTLDWLAHAVAVSNHAAGCIGVIRHQSDFPD